MSQSQTLTDFEKRSSHFSRVRALIMKIVTAKPGLTIEEISKQFLLTYGFLPRINNRIRELRKLGWVTTPEEEDGRLHVYPKNEALT